MAQYVTFQHTVTEVVLVPIFLLSFLQGTTLIPSLTSIMLDENVWETPDTFNPEHFLENGQFRKREAFLPFSAGETMCEGMFLHEKANAMF